MTRLAILALLAATAAPAAAQDAVIRPAAEIRVVERSDGYGRLLREVVEDLQPAEILRLQVELARHGHDPRSRTGTLDAATRRALSRFQEARRLAVCACPSYETVVALGIAPAVVRDTGRTVIVDRRERVIVVYPAHGGRHRGGSSTGVYVGHAPVGTGFPTGRRSGDYDRRPARPSADPRPTYRPARPGARIQGGDNGSDARPSRPSP